MRQLLEAVRAGTMSFDEFARQTDERWKVLARYIWRHWKVPAWLGEEDIHQDLLVAAWTVIPLFDPGRGVDIARMVQWNAVDKAKKRVHKARGANLHGNADSAPSHFEHPFTSFENEDGTANRFAVGEVAPTQEPAVLLEQVVEKVLAQKPGRSPRALRHRFAVRAIVECGGDREAAASCLYDDPDTRLACRFGSPLQVRASVKAAAEAMAEMLQG